MNHIDRAVLQGFPPETLVGMDIQAVHDAMGNAYSVPVIGCVFHALLHMLKQATVTAEGTWGIAACSGDAVVERPTKAAKKSVPLTAFFKKAA